MQRILTVRLPFGSGTTCLVEVSARNLAIRLSHASGGGTGAPRVRMLTSTLRFCVRSFDTGTLLGSGIVAPTPLLSKAIAPLRKGPSFRFFHSLIIAVARAAATDVALSSLTF